MKASRNVVANHKRELAHLTKGFSVFTVHTIAALSPWNFTMPLSDVQSLAKVFTPLCFLSILLDSKLFKKCWCNLLPSQVTALVKWSSPVFNLSVTWCVSINISFLRGPNGLQLHLARSITSWKPRSSPNKSGTKLKRDTSQDWVIKKSTSLMILERHQIHYRQMETTQDHNKPAKMGPTTKTQTGQRGHWSGRQQRDQR